MRRLTVLMTMVAVLGACSTDDAAPTTASQASTTTTSQATTATTPLIEEADLAEVVAHLVPVVEGHAAAWTAQDVDAILSYYDADTVHDDSLFGVVIQGEDLYTMPAGFIVEYDGYRNRVREVFVARTVAIVVDEGWGVTLRGTTFTEESPMLEVDRIEVDTDGTLGRWSLYYDLDQWEAWGSPGFRMDPARALLDEWVAVWESGPASAFQALYATAAERVDTLLGTSATGPDAIVEVAGELVGDATVTADLEFSDSRKAAADVDVVGAVVQFAFPDGCVVRSVALLTAIDGVVQREEIFWDADSLLECGWAA